MGTMQFRFDSSLIFSLIQIQKISEELNLNCIMCMVKGGGGAIPVWGGFSMHGMGLLHTIHGCNSPDNTIHIMDKYVYKDIIKNVLLPYIAWGYYIQFRIQFRK